MKSSVRRVPGRGRTRHHGRVLEWWRRPRLWFVFLVVGAGAAAVLLARFLQAEGRENADQWAGIIFGAISATGVASAALVWLWRQGSAGQATDERIAAAVAVLARAQSEVWSAEQAARRVRDPWPLDVRWLVSPRAEAVMASWGSVLGRPGAGPVPLEGSYEQVAQLFARPDMPRRLVVLGEPGAGKSMLLLQLTLQLLERRTARSPVPVLLPVAGWRPDRSLDDWVAEQLGAVNRLLARPVDAPDGTRRSMARELVARGLVVPVLDGLDEIDEEAQRVALSRVAATDRRLVVSCRTRPYEAAVRATGPIPGAAVVELQPLAAADAAQYLVDGADRADGRWQPVLAHLAEGGRTPLVRALSTPLTIWLARNVYLNPGSDPRELLTAPWAATPEGIEQHLLEHLIPATYTAAVGGHPARTEADARKARHFLMLLARHMREHRTYDLAWWELGEMPPGPAGQMLTVLLAVPAALASVGSSFAAGIYQSETGAAPWVTGLLVGLAAGLLVAYVRLLFRDRRSPRQIVPGGLLRMFLAVGVPTGIIGVLSGGPATGLAVTVGAGLTASLGAGGSLIPGGARGAAGPTASLRADRATGVLAGLTVGAAAVVGALSAGGLGVLPLLALPALVVVALSAWGQFCLTRLLLITRGMPLRLVSALREAHDRGILRQAGGYYQFRHNLLQDHLARDH